VLGVIQIYALNKSINSQPSAAGTPLRGAHYLHVSCCQKSKFRADSVQRLAQEKKRMIRKAIESEMGKVKELFIEYQKWLNVDLCFQTFDDELAGLPGAYAEPKGAIFVSELCGHFVGCVAVRPINTEIAEIKRLYVKPAQQNKGLGESLLKCAIDMAKAGHYNKLVLDTLPIMEKAKKLYEKHGFLKIDAYYVNPLPGVEYYEKKLS